MFNPFKDFISVMEQEKDKKIKKSQPGREKKKQKT